MKTPKRETEHAWCPIGARYTGTEFLPSLSAKERTRWRRKNRIVQFKRTIARLEREKIEAYLLGHADGLAKGLSQN